MAKQTTKYFAVVGLDFEGLKPPVRVEANDPIPDKVPAAEITELLRQGLIRVQPEAMPEESEGDE